jgi:hypothetical protein
MYSAPLPLVYGFKFMYGTRRARTINTPCCRFFALSENTEETQQNSAAAAVAENRNKCNRAPLF